MFVVFFSAAIGSPYRWVSFRTDWDELVEEPDDLESEGGGPPPAVEATRRSGMEAHLASLSAGVEEECPLHFARSPARPSTHAFPKKASESSLQAMVRLGTS